MKSVIDKNKGQAFSSSPESVKAFPKVHTEREQIALQSCESMIKPME